MVPALTRNMVDMEGSAVLTPDSDSPEETELPMAEVGRVTGEQDGGDAPPKVVKSSVCRPASAAVAAQRRMMERRQAQRRRRQQGRADPPPSSPSQEGHNSSVISARGLLWDVYGSRNDDIREVAWYQSASSASRLSNFSPSDSDSIRAAGLGIVRVDSVARGASVELGMADGDTAREEVTAECGVSIRASSPLDGNMKKRLVAECCAQHKSASDGNPHEAERGLAIPVRRDGGVSTAEMGALSSLRIGTREAGAARSDIVRSSSCSSSAAPAPLPSGRSIVPGAYSVSPDGGSVLLHGGTAAEATVEGGFADELEEVDGAPSTSAFPTLDGVGGGVIDGEGNVIATAVTDAEAVVFARKVTRDQSTVIKFGACLLALVGIVVGVTVGVTVGERSNGSTAQAVEEPRWSECILNKPPSLPRHRHEGLRMTLLTEDLYKRDPHAAAMLDAFCSPQNRALNWLAEDDKLVIETSALNQKKIVQRFAVSTFFFATNGTGWDDPLDWMSEAQECDWVGINCGVADVDGFAPVTFLSLRSGNKPGGELPREIGLLKYLQNLNVGGHGLGGSIPSEIGMCTDLMDLFAAANQLTGSLPEELFSSQMASLTQLNLGRNLITGLPENIGEGKNIRAIVLPHNQLRGSIPASFVDMEKLAHFTVPRNFLTGTVPSGIGKLNGSMTIFDVSNNNLEGTLPDSISSLRWLNCMGVGGNMFTGTIPALPQCLGRLQIGGNSFRGPFTEETCSRFEEHEGIGAIICGADNSQCPCCDDCPTENALFCRPGLEAELPGGCSKRRPGGPSPADGKPARPEGEMGEGGGGGVPPPGRADGGGGRPPERNLQ